MMLRVFSLTGLDLAEQILKAYLLAASERSVLLLGLALFNKLASHALISNGIKCIACTGDLGHAGYLNWNRGACLGDANALIVYHRAHTADGGTGNDDIAELKRTVLDKNGHDRAAALIKSRLDDGALCGAVGVGLEFLNLCE